MRVNRIFTPLPLAVNRDVTLTPEASRYLATVLRVKSGEPVILFNGEGGEYSGEVGEISGKEARVSITAHRNTERESPLITRLGIGLSRGERFEWVLQKATELGVSEIFPLQTERTEVRLRDDREEKKQRRWQQIIISACEQCGRNRLPRLHTSQKLEDWQNIDAEIKLVLHHRSDTTVKALGSVKPASAALAIGPEGGLSDAEIQLLLNNGFQSLTLGPRVLRTETAPLVALTVFQSLWGDY